MDEDAFQAEAKVMVDETIDKAISNLNINVLEREKSIESLKLEMSRQNTFTARQEDYDIQNIEWLSIQEFTVPKGEEKITEFIKTWDHDNSWLYCIDFLTQDEHEFDTRYSYRVRWSIPTRRKPIPRATASVYFTFNVSKIKPKDHPVDVFYVFETNRLIHRPGQSRFREKWLKDVIESKVLLMESVQF